MYTHTINRKGLCPQAIRPKHRSAFPNQHSVVHRQAATRRQFTTPRTPLGARLDLDAIRGVGSKVLVQSVQVETASGVAGVASLPGTAAPLGPSKTAEGVNFALYAKHAKSVSLCLYDSNNKQVEEVALDPRSNKTGDVWHVELQGLPAVDVLYGYRIDGTGGWETGFRWYPKTVLLDPYAPLVSGRKTFGVRDEVEGFVPKVGSKFWGTYDFASEPFDWGEDYKRPGHHMKDLVIYEMAVRCFTADPSSGVPKEQRGSYLGVAAKVDHLKALGVNAVELLPVCEYDEFEFQRRPNARDHMINVWGYSPMAYSAPMSRFGTAGCGAAQAAREFKEMVKTLHAAGIEVLLDVVYNHTVEGDDNDPYVISFRGIECSTYYITDTSQYVQLLNYSGCGNTINANHPVTQKMIIDSLLHWHDEYHVDGFRFDLGSCLCRDGKGAPMKAPPVIREIAKHPVLGKLKLIAEPWDIGMYQVGSFPNWDTWGEWNGKYRDDVRRFVKGDPGMKGPLATRLAGSADLYQTHNRKPYHSVNFVIAHDGFSLYDWVAYNGKHNEVNGEGGRDGTNDNFSWNCGAEGETSDGGVRGLRYRQMRNAMVVLMMSQGTPMIVMGDEVAKSHGGNNNWYGHDKALAHMQWDEQDDDKKALFRFMSELIKFRRSHPGLGRAEFLRPEDITWHENNWDNTESRFLAFTLHDRGLGGGDVYAAFNSHSFGVDVSLPPPPPGQFWGRLVDTNLPSPRDFTVGGNKGVEPKYTIAGFASIILIAKPQSKL